MAHNDHEFYESALYLRAMLLVARDAGFDESEILNRANVSPEILDDIFGLVNYEDMKSVFLTVGEAAKVPAMGMHMAQKLELVMMDQIGFAVATAENLRDSLKLGMKFMHMVSNSFSMEIREESEKALVEYAANVPDCPVSRGMLEFFLTNTALIAPRELGINLTPEVVQFTFEAPAYHEAYQQALNCPVQYESDANQIVFDADYLNTPMPARNFEINQKLIQEVEAKILSFREQGPLTRKVWDKMENTDSLPSGLNEMADMMNVPARTLQAKLSQEDTSFSQIRDKFRMQRGIKLLKMPGMTVEEVSSRLGFSEISAFYRAFHNWKGTSPRRYLQQTTP